MCARHVCACECVCVLVYVFVCVHLSVSNQQAHLVLAACEWGFCTQLQRACELSVTDICTHPLATSEHCGVGAWVGLVQNEKLQATQTQMEGGEGQSGT